MLQRLYINNYAIINELEINFSKGMNSITGETGAGKSILIGALSLILGERADSTTLVNKEKKCVIEGVFSLEEREDIKNFFATNDVDAQPDTILRREITVQGKSRAFINDTPVTLSQLQQLSLLLVDMHRQFDTQEVGDNTFQLTVLDALAGNQQRLSEYQKVFYQWQAAVKKLSELKQQQIQYRQESDYNQFQYDELQQAAFKENELENISTELQLLTHAEGIKAALSKVYNELENTEQPIVQVLKSYIHLLTPFSNYQKDLPALIERLQALQVELQDVAAELEHVNNRIHYDAHTIALLNERLSLGYKLQKKHGAHTTQELLHIQQALEEKLQAVLHIADDMNQWEQRSAQLAVEAAAIAKAISRARQKQIKPFETKVNQLLAQVGMPNAALQVSFENKALHATGGDAINFLFDANKSGQFKPVSKVASGGELSRLMLCIKSLVAECMDMPTLIFDEIDTGISGEAAKQVGLIMKGLAASRQIICITHQPQIAGKANAHFFVYKEKMGTTVNTNIRQLTHNERITAVAQMLSGEKPTAAAIANAQEMIEA